MDDRVAAALIEVDRAQVVGEHIEGQRAVPALDGDRLGLGEELAADALPPRLR